MILSFGFYLGRQTKKEQKEFFKSMPKEDQKRLFGTLKEGFEQVGIKCVYKS